MNRGTCVNKGMGRVLI